MKGRLKTILGLTSALGLVHAAQAAAQTAPTPPGDARATSPPSQALSQPAQAAQTVQTQAQLGEVIVTARRVQEKLQDVPISITVFNQQQLSNLNIVTASNLATYTPSLSISQLYGPQNTSFSIRGFNQQFGTQPTVGVYFADVVSPRAASNSLPIGDGAGSGSFFDLQNVQVLKGPQGTLFGLNTTGGAILLVPQKPTSKFEGYGEVSAGDYDLSRVQAAVNIPVADRVRLRFGFDHETRDGYLKNDTSVGPHAFNNIDYTALRGSLVVDLMSNLENYTVASYTHSNTNGDLQKLTFVSSDPATYPLSGLAAGQVAYRNSQGGGFYSVENIFAKPSTRQEQYQVVNTTTWRPSNTLTVKDIVSYAELKEDIRSQFLAARLNVGSANLGIFDVNPAPGAHTANQSTFTNEFQVQGSALGDRLTYQGGVYIELSNPIGLSGSQSDNFLNCTTPDSLLCANPLGAGSVSDTVSQTAYRDYGVYIQSTYSLTRQLKLTGGFRYTYDRTQTTSQQYAYSFPYGVTYNAPTGRSCSVPTATANCYSYYKEQSQAPTGLVDLEYKPFQDILTYVKYSRGYRSGGISPGVPTEYAVYQPEHLNAYEVGFKSSFRGPVPATLDAAGFYNDLSNEQTMGVFQPRVTGSAASATGAVNAEKSRNYGFEFEGSVTPYTGLTFDLSYAYINAKILKIGAITLPASSLYVASSAAVSGDPELNTPENQVTASANYTLPLDPRTGRVSVGVTFTHIDAAVSNYSNRNANGSIAALSMSDPENLLDLVMNWKSIAGNPVDLQLFATNVTNEAYYHNRAGLYPSVGFEFGGIGEPRMFGGRLRYHFGS